jgi:hypothetical protein
MPTRPARCARPRGPALITGSMAAAHRHHRLHRCARAARGKWKRNTKLLPAPVCRSTGARCPDAGQGAEVKPAMRPSSPASGTSVPKAGGRRTRASTINMGGIDRGGPYGGKKYFSPYGNPRLRTAPRASTCPTASPTETAKFIEANRERLSSSTIRSTTSTRPLMAPRGPAEAESTRRSGSGSGWRRSGAATRARRPARAGARRLRRHGRGDGPRRGQGARQARRTRPAENTLVIFTSDNGGLSTSEGWPTSNLPLRGGKGWMYEGGIREPLIVRWPGEIKAGQRHRTRRSAARTISRRCSKPPPPSPRRARSSTASASPVLAAGGSCRSARCSGTTRTTATRAARRPRRSGARTSRRLEAKFDLSGGPR